MAEADDGEFAERRAGLKQQLEGLREELQVPSHAGCPGAHGACLLLPAPAAASMNQTHLAPTPRLALAGAGAGRRGLPEAAGGAAGKPCGGAGGAPRGAQPGAVRRIQQCLCCALPFIVGPDRAQSAETCLALHIWAMQDVVGALRRKASPSSTPSCAASSSQMAAFQQRLAPLKTGSAGGDGSQLGRPMLRNDSSLEQPGGAPPRRALPRPPTPTGGVGCGGGGDSLIRACYRPNDSGLGSTGSTPRAASPASAGGRSRQVARREKGRVGCVLCSAAVWLANLAPLCVRRRPPELPNPQAGLGCRGSGLQPVGNLPHSSAGVQHVTPCSAACGVRFLA